MVRVAFIGARFGWQHMVAPHAPRPPSPASTRSKLAGCNLLRARDALAEVLSCGVLLFNEHDEILLAHATGNRHWDVPKGLADPGETPLAAALRETREETGIDLDESGWSDLGRHGYRPGKDLHLFARRVSTTQVRIADCVCTSLFVHARSGKSLPEADSFGWFAVTRLQERCARSMATLLVTKGLAVAALAAIDPLPERTTRPVP